LNPSESYIEERIDGVEKVTGSATYAADVSRPGMLHAKILRSTVPHARIVSIDASRALALPGVRVVLTGADLPPVRIGRSMRDMPVLAQGKVRFIGEKVAAVAADTLEIALQALDLIDVEYEELPAVFDPLDAMEPNAPVIHDPAEVRAQATPKQQPGDYPNSVSAPVWGVSETDIKQVFASAAHTFEHTFRTPVQHQGYLEPHACIVELDDRDVAHIWASNKAPFLLLDYLRLGLGLTREQVEIHMLPLGGDFGGKGSFMDIPLAYFLAKAARRPVKLVMTFAEELMAANPRHSAVITVRSAFDGGGKLVGRWTRSVYNSGAYAAFKPAPDATLPGIRGGSLGPYEVSAFRIEGHMVYTNTVPCGHMRAPGEAQPMHAVECHMDLCAREMGIDPLELRLINAPHELRKTPSGEPGTPLRAREVLQEAAKAIGLHDPRPEGIGRGIALVEVGNSLGDYQMGMTIERNGSVVVHTPIIENGAGMLTVFRQMAAEELGLTVEHVRINQTTDGIEYDRGVGGSRITRLIGRMISMLAERLQNRLAEMVAAEFGYEADQVTREDGGFRTPDGKLLSLADAASLAPDDIHDLLRYEPNEFDSVEVFAAVGVEASVDRETGQVKTKRIVSAHEVGRVVHPVMHQGQIEGGLTQGFGYALCEGLTFEDGRVTMVNLQDYKLPVGIDLPEMETILLPADLSLGITPIGEGPNCAMSAAIVNAVVDVLGRQVEIPISSEAIALG